MARRISLSVRDRLHFYAEEATLTLLAALEPGARSPYSSIPISNRALLGLRTDRDFVASPLYTATVGEPVGARYGGNLLAFLLSGFTSVESRSVAGVADGFDMVRWSAGDPALEPTDLSEYARSLIFPETDANEWYFPLRLLIDMSALTLDLTGVSNFVPHSEVEVPTLGDRGRARPGHEPPTVFQRTAICARAAFSRRTSYPVLPTWTCSRRATIP